MGVLAVPCITPENLGRASLILALFAGLARAQTIANASFESGAPGSGLPTQAAVWSGDPTQFVGASLGVTPRTGTRMVRFDATTVSGPTGSIGSELIQLVDLSASAALVQTGAAVMTAEAWCNRVAGDASTDTQFLIGVRAYAGLIGNFPTDFNHSESALTDGLVNADALESTWERAVARLCLPPSTTYVAIRFTAVENVVNDVSGPEFAGHFGEDVSVALALDPLAIQSFCVGAPNSVGPGASITATGSTSVAANDFTLVVAGAPPNVPGLFYYGRTSGQTPFGDGWRCIQGTSYRLGPPVATNGSGAATRFVNLTVPPASTGLSAITPYQSWSFQYWYRNVLGPGGTGFNLTNGVAATFRP